MIKQKFSLDNAVFTTPKRRILSFVFTILWNRRNRREVRLGYPAYRNCVARRHLCEAIKTTPKAGGLTDLKYYTLLIREVIFGSSLNFPNKGK